MKGPRNLVRDVARGTVQALIAIELGELARARLPWPFDPEAETKVLCALAHGSLRSEVKAEWFYIPIHESLARACKASPARDAEAIVHELAKEARIHASAGELVDFVSVLLASEYTVDEVARALERMIELHTARALVAELEATARALRVEALTTEQVRRRLFQLGSESE